MICVSYNYYILHSNNSFTMLSDILILHTLHTYIPTHTHTYIHSHFCGYINSVLYEVLQFPYCYNFVNYKTSIYNINKQQCINPHFNFIVI